MYTANAYFLTQVTIWACCMFAYSRQEDIEIMRKVFKFDAVNKLIPAILLIITVLLFRCRFNSKQSKKVFAREKLIVVHVAIFLLFVTSYAASLVLYSYYVRSPVGSI